MERLCFVFFSPCSCWCPPSQVYKICNCGLQIEMKREKKHKKHHISWITSHSFRSDVLPRTLLWVQLQLHCWATVHTRTGSQMTACGCRRSCYRERASSRGRHHWRTFPPVKEKETLVKLTVKISEKQCSVWQYINFTLFQSSFWLDMIKNPPSSIK